LFTVERTSAIAMHVTDWLLAVPTGRAIWYDPRDLLGWIKQHKQSGAEAEKNRGKPIT
jgi:hypothetical protein